MKERKIVQQVYQPPRVQHVQQAQPFQPFKKEQFLNIAQNKQQNFDIHARNVWQTPLSEENRCFPIQAFAKKKVAPVN